MQYIGMKQSVKAGEHTLVGYTYDVAGKSFLLTQLSYGNGNSVAYEYDDLDRILAVRYDGETNPGVEYLYDNMGSATLRKDNIAQVQTKQLYDFADRLCRIEEKGMGSNALDHTYEWTYDQRDNVASITETLNGTNWEINFAYNADDILTQTTYGNNAFANTFDALGRQTQRTHTVSGSTRMTTTYGYINPDSAHTTTLLSTVRNRGTQFDKTTAYTYDDRGNITSVTANGSTTTYAYDNLGQLTRENNQAAGKTWTWTYDTAGNILSKSEYAYTTGSLGTALDTITYGYADSRGWGDLLTSYDGRSFQYDEIGNLLSDGEWTYTWAKGRQLVSMTKPGSTLTFTYDADGNRITKTVNGTTTTYTYADGRVTHETNDTDTIHYRYDTNGTLLSMNLNGTEYYYLYNGQRDVIGLYDANGNVVVEYTYDAWGKPLTTTGSLASTVGAKNPYRYRGYRYDTESGLYSLKTRYYSPEVKRFISSDDGFYENNGIFKNNLYIYCCNSPLLHRDDSGHVIEYIYELPVILVEILLIAAVLVGTSYLVTETVKQISPTARMVIDSKIIACCNTLEQEAYDSIASNMEYAQAKAAAKGSNNKTNVHHIVAANDIRASISRDVLQAVDIDPVRSESNLVSVNESVHRFMHTNEYHVSVTTVMVCAYVKGNLRYRNTRKEVNKALNNLKRIIGTDYTAKSNKRTTPMRMVK